MFGDFSRFENDPEVGLNGIYLSQGSPILDSDWNEQVAALTDWITVVGRLAAGGDAFAEEKVRQIGFEVKPIESKITVGPGMALIAGRVVQTSRLHSTDDKYSRFLEMHEADKESRVCLVLQDSTGSRTKKGSSYRQKTDWRIAVVPADKLADAAKNGVRSYGDGHLYTPRMKCFADSTSARILESSDFSESTVAVVEYHGKDEGKDLFKLAACPDNLILGTQIVVAGDKKSLSFPATAIPCGILGASECYVEYIDDEVEFGLTISMLHGDGNPAISEYDVKKSVDGPLRLVSAKVSVANDRVTLSEMESSFAKLSAHEHFGKTHYRIRVWNFTQLNTPGGSLPFPGFRAEYSQPAGQVPIPGDRWYIPMRNGRPEWTESDQMLPLPGHRVFRAIGSLAKVKVEKGNDGSWKYSAGMSDALDSAPIALLSSRSDADMVAVHRPGPLQPVAHRLDDSLHRLTGALNAARSLTRQTPCKELTTRVSYLPLRRWLASAYVHEIADLDLDGFLAKVRRSIDVAPEDEHRFREQAGLILEEANQLAGSITPRPRSDTNRESDTMVSTPSDNSHPMTLGSATRDALQQAFTQEIPRA